EGLGAVLGAFDAGMETGLGHRLVCLILRLRITWVRRRNQLESGHARFWARSTDKVADRSRRREEAEVFTEMRGLVFRLLTSAATLSFALPARWPEPISVLPFW